MYNYYIIASIFASLGGAHEYSSIIVGGNETTIGKYPFQVSIEVETLHVCSGVLIKDNIVLTAASCMIYPTKDYCVRAGSNVTEFDGQLSAIDCFENHPKYKGFMDYDISVVKLKYHFELNYNVRPIILNTSYFKLSHRIAVSEPGISTGWENKTFESPEFKVLQEVRLYKAHFDDCDINLERMTPRMLCYGNRENERMSCQGDLGAPLLVGNELIGIASLGSRCRYPSFPGIFTNIGDQEINNHILKSVNTLITRGCPKHPKESKNIEFV